MRQKHRKWIRPQQGLEFSMNRLFLISQYISVKKSKINTENFNTCLSSNDLNFCPKDIRIYIFCDTNAIYFNNSDDFY